MTISLSEVVESLSQLAHLGANPEQLLESLRKTATMVLGATAVDAIMDTAVGAALDALQGLFAAAEGVASGYPALLPPIALNAGDYLREKGGAALQTQIQGVIDSQVLLSALHLRGGGGLVHIARRSPVC